MDVIIARPLIKVAIEAIQQGNIVEELGLFLIDKLSNRIPFEGEDAQIREILADYYCTKALYELAAQQLKSIRVDSSHR